MGNQQAQLNKFQNEIFNLKFRSKQMQKMASKFEKESVQYKKKVKKAMQNGNMDVAKIHADTAIHKHNAGNQMLKLSSRIDATVNRMESMLQQKKVSKMLASVSKDLDPMINSNTMTKMTTVMDNFEMQFQNIDIHTQVMNDAIDTGTSTLYNENQVDDLLQNIADENAMDVQKLFDDAGIGKNKIKTQLPQTDEEKQVTKKLQGLLDL